MACYCFSEDYLKCFVTCPLTSSEYSPQFTSSLGIFSTRESEMLERGLARILIETTISGNSLAKLFFSPSYPTSNRCSNIGRRVLLGFSTPLVVWHWMISSNGLLGLLLHSLVNWHVVTAKMKSGVAFVVTGSVGWPALGGTTLYFHSSYHGLFHQSQPSPPPHPTVLSDSLTIDTQRGNFKFPFCNFQLNYFLLDRIPNSFKAQ